jgi:acyl CoA:acetate/3-ketoacid CoA transferase alpha subunit
MDELDQVCLWVVGFSLHDDLRSLCVPDMSCCLPLLLAPREVREAYLAAYMGQFDEDPRRARRARLQVKRMNLGFLHRRMRAGG